jgi:hypothetical protein
MTLRGASSRKLSVDSAESSADAGLVTAWTPVPATAPSTAPIADPLPLPRTAPIIAPTPAPPVIAAAAYAFRDAPCFEYWLLRNSQVLPLKAS